MQQLLSYQHAKKRRQTAYQLYVVDYICDWPWENQPLMHKDKYLEIRNS